MIHDDMLRTDRLLVRPFESADIPGLIGLFADPRVARWVGEGEALSHADAALWVERSRANLARFGYGTGAIVERATGEMVGWAGFARPQDGPEQIIYGLAHRHWRRGFGREIVAALIGYARDALRHQHVVATLYPENVISARLLINAGFQRDHTHDDPSSHLYHLALA